MRTTTVPAGSVPENFTAWPASEASGKADTSSASHAHFIANRGIAIFPPRN
jgi:hypothetical protein